MTIEKRHNSGSLPLPPYRAVLAVDAEKFSRANDLGYQVLGPLIPEVLARAFERSGLGHVWQDARFARHSGDGYVLGAEPHHLPHLIHPFLDTLHDELEALQPRLAFQDRNLRLRLRASVDVGPLPDTGGRSAIDAMGEAMVQVHRLLDAEPVKRELASSDPDTTLLVAVVSRRVYEDAVLSGLCGVRPSRFRPVNVSIPAKEYRAEGYLYVPVPSTAAHSASAAETSGPASPAPAPPAVQDTPAPVTNTFRNTGNAQNIIQSGTINGGVHASREGR